MRAIDRAIIKILLRIPARDSEDFETDGGHGSGNWGHKGRPGKRGGSGKGGGTHYRGANKRLDAPDIASRIAQKANASAAKEFDAKPLNYKTDWADKYIPKKTYTKQSFKDYSNTGDRKMNSLLRGGGVASKHLDELNKKIQKTREEIKAMTDDIASHSTDKDIILHRGIQSTGGAIAALGLNIHADDFHGLCKNGDFVDSLVGYTFRDDGFSSTSINGGSSFNGPCQLEILAPKGTHGTYMAHDSYFIYEQEFLLQRGTQFAITGAKYENGTLKLQATIINQTPQEIPDAYWTAPNIGEDTVGVKKGFNPPASNPRYHPEQKPTSQPAETPQSTTPAIATPAPVTQTAAPVQSTTVVPELANVLPKQGLWNHINNLAKTEPSISNIYFSEQLSHEYPNVESKYYFAAEYEAVHNPNTPEYVQKDSVNQLKTCLMMETYSGNLSPQQAADIYSAVTIGTKYESKYKGVLFGAKGQKELYEEAVASPGYSLKNDVGEELANKLNSSYKKASLAFKAYLGAAYISGSTTTKNFIDNLLPTLWKQYAPYADENGHVDMGLDVPLF